MGARVTDRSATVAERLDDRPPRVPELTVEGLTSGPGDRLGSCADARGLRRNRSATGAAS